MTRSTMQPLAALSRDVAGGVRAVLTDIDDTLTAHGRLPAAAYAALEALRAAGILVVPVTGRPAGWCDLIARQWPADAVVGENGAFWYRHDEAARRMVRRSFRSAAERLADRARLAAIEAEVLREVPGAAVAADQPFRAADLAIDFCEDVPPLGPEAVRRIVSIFERHGATAKVSSIHVNGWFGHHDKLSASLSLLAEVFGLDAQTAQTAAIFVGDSPNDAPMFGYFRHAVGVANVRAFSEGLSAWPAYVTEAPAAAGFAEFAAHLLTLRG